MSDSLEWQSLDLELFKSKQLRMKAQKQRRRKIKRVSKKRGAGIIDRAIDLLPFELHAPNYQFCGPGTHLEKRIKRGDSGINPLDAACKQHDIEYSKHLKSEERSIADKILQNQAMKRVFSKDASLAERATALGVAAAMKIKRKLTKKGKGLTKRQTNKKKKKENHVSFSALIKSAKAAIKKSKPDTIASAIDVAVSSVKKSKKGKRVKAPRTIPLPPVVGGVLPLIPIFAGLSALGTIAGTAASITNAINSAKRGQLDLDESKRHNRTMESIAIGNKLGKGFYLKANKNGKGFFLKPYAKNR